MKRGVAGRSNFRVWRVIGVVLLAGLGREAWAQPVCTNELIRIETRRVGARTEVYVTNLQPVEVTATIDMVLANMKGDVTFPFTQVFPGRREMKAFTLWPEEPRRSWNFRYQFKSVFGNHKARHDDRHVYRLPYAAGQSYRVVQGSNGRFSHFGEEQHALDWRMPEGTPVLAAREGVVAAIRQDVGFGGPNPAWRDCANFVMVRHADGTIGHYVHLKKDGVRVRVDQLVRAGEVLGWSGNTGYSQGPHLHFAVFKARNGRERETIPVKFDTDQGKAMTLKEGQSYAVP